MVRRHRLERFSKGKVPLVIEKASGIKLSRILNGIIGGETDIVKTIFETETRIVKGNPK